MRMSKAQIIQAGAALNVPYGLTHSCYDPVNVPQPPFTLACGHCDSCQLRRKGFAEAAVPDPTQYA
jgi:7-cyano-7-deazaguanine synthase